MSSNILVTKQIPWRRNASRSCWDCVKAAYVTHCNYGYYLCFENYCTICTTKKFTPVIPLELTLGFQIVPKSKRGFPCWSIDSKMDGVVLVVTWVDRKHANFLTTLHKSGYDNEVPEEERVVTLKGTKINKRELSWLLLLTWRTIIKIWGV